MASKSECLCFFFGNDLITQLLYSALKDTLLSILLIK